MSIKCIYTPLSMLRKNRYTPAKFLDIKVGFNGIYISRTCFPDVSFD